jgi:hypothetical protein
MRTYTLRQRMPGTVELYRSAYRIMWLTTDTPLRLHIAGTIHGDVKLRPHEIVPGSWPLCTAADTVAEIVQRVRPKAKTKPEKVRELRAMRDAARSFLAQWPAGPQL